ncbi:MFS transporter [Streptomyces corchorusii]|uniref:MFS transporter n=2 Tax=Streptomyces TaxID=1883 RepID=A0A117QAN6_STRCK|nr:MFS transporter [Streptomyces corchorusii]AEY88432.1 integral membrane transport protein [Streptomyces hygroscopicus subsp. jinggangensis 5008]AGF62588.1 integral membrane transport protein [Streptomyces hygroscopicus subsp. jinggangensis TL01]ALO92864.1 Integral membrane transport protein [Streptomyces hygroscopicus subsp. limoneus]KUN17861.1 MFS transporter [Streptomyces corchorusii]
MGPGGNRGWLLRLVIAFGCAQGAVSMARPAVSYRALALGADERAVGVIAGVYALLPLFAAVPLGRRTDHGRCAPLLPAGVVLIAAGCALSGLAGSLWAMALWSGVMGLGHLCFVIGAQSLVARQSAPHEQDRNFGHFTIGASLGQLIGPVAAGALIGGPDMARSSALALVVAGAGAAVAFTSLWRVEDRTAVDSRASSGGRVPVGGILRARGVPAGMLISLSVLSATDILTAYLPVVGEHRGIAPSVIGVLLSLRAGATIACRLVLTPLLRLLGRPALLTVTCLLAALLCAGVALPVPVWALGVMLTVLGFCLGVGQPLSMTTVVQAAPAEARSTALALRLTGNRLGQVAAPAAAGLVAGLAGVAAPFVMLGALLLVSSAVALRSPGRAEGASGRVAGKRPKRPGLRRTSDL